MKRIIYWFDKIPLTFLLILNLFIGVLLLLAHGGYTIASYYENGFMFDLIVTGTSAMFAMLVVVTCIMAFIKANFRDMRDVHNLW
jgi:hypothetical protein